MRAAGPSPDNQKTCPIGSHGVAPCVRENSRLAFRWRPRPDLQLRGARKPHPIFDLEWRDGARGTHRFFFPMTPNLIVFGRKWKLKLGLSATLPLGRGFLRGI